MKPDSLQFTINRDELLRCVRLAASILGNEDDRRAVLAFAQDTPRVAVGAWVLPSCRCPISAVGIDRFREDAQKFAGLFDQYMCEDALGLDVEDVHEDPVIVGVL